MESSPEKQADRRKLRTAPTGPPSRPGAAGQGWQLSSIEDNFSSPAWSCWAGVGSLPGNQATPDSLKRPARPTLAADVADQGSEVVRQFHGELTASGPHERDTPMDGIHGPTLTAADHTGP